MSLDRFLNVEVNYLDPTANRPADMSTLLFARRDGAFDQASGTLTNRRVNQFSNLAAVLDAGYVATDEEYLMAAKYFGAPRTQPPVFIGHWDSVVATAETPQAALADIAKYMNTWHFVTLDSTMQAPTAPVTIAHIQAMATYLQGAGKDQMLIMGATGEDALDSTSATNLVAVMGAAEYTGASGIWTPGPYASSVIAGIYSATDWNLPNVLKSLKFQRLPGETPGVLTAGQADVLEDRNCNYFTEYEQVDNFVAEGVTFAGRWFDYEFGLAWLKKAVTRDLAIAFTAPDQVEGTNAGVGTLKTAASAVLTQARTAGLIASNGRVSDVHRDQIRNLTNNDLFDGFIAGGFFVYAPDVTTLTASQRATRAAPPITVYLVGRPAFHSGSVQLNFVGGAA